MSYVLSIARVIGHFHDDVIMTKVPEVILLSHSCFNLSILLRFQEKWLKFAKENSRLTDLVVECIKMLLSCNCLLKITALGGKFEYSMKVFLIVYHYCTV